MDVPAKGNVLGGCLPVRYILAILGLVGMVIIHGLNENISLSGVSARMMMNHTALRLASMGRNIATDSKFMVFTSNEKCINLKDLNIRYDRRMLQTPVDGPIEANPGNTYMYAYRWGYQMSIFIGARRAEVQSAKWVMFFGVVLSILCTLLIPMIGWISLILLGIIRFGQGIAAGTVYPAVHVLLARWAPLTERGFMTTIVNSGKSLGPVLSALVASVLFTAIGWRSVFFISAVLSAIWCLLWIVLLEDSPQRQRLIDIEERSMIIAALGNVIGDHPFAKQPVPWRLVFKSPAFLAILITYICFTVGYFTLAFWVPIYMYELMNYDLNEDLSTMTFAVLSQILFSISLSVTLDLLNSRNYISTTTARKISTAFAIAVPAICFILFCFTGCSRIAAVLLWILALTASGGIFCGVYANVIDIAPRFAGTVVAVCDTLSLLVIIIFMPLVMFGIFDGRLLFIITIVMYLIGLVVYSVWASSEEQQWDMLPKEDDTTLLAPNTQTSVETTSPSTSQDTQL